MFVTKKQAFTMLPTSKCYMSKVLHEQIRQDRLLLKRGTIEANIRRVDKQLDLAAAERNAFS